jgi:DHA2 family multidrug resistance protein
MTAAATYGGADLSQARRIVILVVASGCTMLNAMSVTIANVVLPQMQGSLSATQDQIAWTVTFNLIATAVATPMTGWLTSRFGRRRLMLASVLGFTVSTVLCGTADSLFILVLWRILNGVFGAPLVPLSQAILLDTFPRHQHGLVTALWGVGVVIGPIIGPSVGGIIAEASSWRWVFFMVGPFGILAYLGAFLAITEKQSNAGVRLDWTGFLVLSIAIMSFQLMLDRGERQDWFESPEIVVEAAVAAICFYVFVVHSLSARQPFLNPRLLLDRNYAIGILFVFIFGMLNFTPMVLFPPLLQNLRGYPDSVIGWLLSMRGIGNLLSFFTAVYITRFDPRLALAGGFGLQALSSLCVAQFDINLTTFDVAWTSMMQGYGVGMTWVPLTVIAFSTLESKHLPEGTAVFHLLRNFGSSIYISVCVALVLRTGKISYAGMAEKITPYNESLDYSTVVGGWNLDSLSGLLALSGEALRQASMIGYINAFYLVAITGFSALPLLLFIKMPKRARA